MLDASSKKADSLAAYSRAVSAREQGRSSSSNLVEAARLDPLNESLHFEAATALIAEEKAAEALDLLERLAGRVPRSAMALRWMALAQQVTGKTEEAEKTLQKALRLDPKRTELHLDLAELQARSTRIDEALETIELGIAKAAEPKPLLRLAGNLIVLNSRLRRAAKQAPAPAPPGILRALTSEADSQPPDREWLLLLAQLLVIEGNTADAVPWLHRAEATDPANVRLKQRCAAAFALTPDREEALQTLFALTTSEDPDSRTAYYLGSLLEMTELREEAAEAYRRSIALDPTAISAYLRLAVIQSALGEVEEAVLTVQDGLVHNPEEERFLELLAYLQLGRGAAQEAAEAFAQAEEKMQAKGSSPLSASFPASFAYALQLAGDIEGAADRLQQAWRKDEAYLQAYVQQAFRSGSPNQAAGRAVVEALATKQASEPDIWIVVGRVRSFMSDPAGAVAAYAEAERLAAAEPDGEGYIDTSFLFWYGSAAERSGDFDRAIALFQRCIARKPPKESKDDHAIYIEALNYVAYLWAERGIELDKALPLISEALEAQPENAAFIDTRGWIFYQQGRYEEAYAELSRAAEILPDDPTIADHMGDVSNKLGLPDEALAWWKKAFTLDLEAKGLAAKLTSAGIDLAPLREEASTKARLKQESPLEDSEENNGFPLDAPLLDHPDPSAE